MKESNALPNVFWSKDGYRGYWGYGCKTFDQNEYCRIVIRGEDKTKKYVELKKFDSTALEIAIKNLENKIKMEKANAKK